MTKTQFMQKRCTEMCDFCMTALMFLTGHEIKARTHAHVESAHFQMRCLIRTWKAFGLWLHASQALMRHLVGKCVISAWVWVLAISKYPLKCVPAILALSHSSGYFNIQ